MLKTSKPAAGAKLRECNQRYKREVNATKTYMRKERHVTSSVTVPVVPYLFVVRWIDMDCGLPNSCPADRAVADHDAALFVRQIWLHALSTAGRKVRLVSKLASCLKANAGGPLRGTIESCAWRSAQFLEHRALELVCR